MNTQKNYARIIIAGTHSGVGKTTMTLGVLLALKKRGLSVQPFKIGPDYIDTAFHSEIAGRECRNLDSYLLKPAVVRELFEKQAGQADVSVIEGVMGLFDGAGSDGARGSTAHVASIIAAPVILVVDVGKMAHSAAAIVRGYVEHAAGIHIVGCIVNNVASENHYAIVKQAIEKNTRVRVLGYLPKNHQIALPERHLGLRPVQETGLKEFSRRLAGMIEKTIDIDSLLQLARKAKKISECKRTIYAAPKKTQKVRIAYAYDSCFHFYYRDNLEMLTHFGAELVPFSPISDLSLPENIQGVYIGGGFPEVFASALAKNEAIRSKIREKSRGGIPMYAECGGLMYLMNKIVLKDGSTLPMVGVFPGTVKMGRRLQTFGYHDIQVIHDTILAPSGAKNRGHVFHWSYVTNMPKRIPRAFKLKRGSKEIEDGYVRANTLASYVHIHFGSNIQYVKQFIKSCNEYQ